MPSKPIDVSAGPALDALAPRAERERMFRRFGLRLGDAEGALPVSVGAAPSEGRALVLQESWSPGHWRLLEWQDGRDHRLERLMRRHSAGLDPQTIHAAAASFPDDRPGLLAELLPGMPVSGRDTYRRFLAIDALMNAATADPEALAALIADGAVAMTRETPTVSIIINTYNYAAYLGEAIESALAQSQPADEVIVVDDGSTDGSAEIIGRYPNVTPIFKKNGGQGSAFNAGFAAAQGDLILFLDADDRLLPDAVTRLRAEPMEGLSRLSFGLETIDALGQPTGLYPISRQAEGGALEGPLKTRGFLMMMPTSGNAFPRAALEALLPMPEAPWRISADVYLAFGAACLGETRHLDAVLGQYRVHGSNAYHATLGAEAPYAMRKLAQRRQAFYDLAKKLRRPDLRPMSRLANALPLRGGQTRPGRFPIGALGRHLRAADPAEFGGSATWPILDPGAVRDLTIPLTEPPFGTGWRFLPGRGVALEGAFGALAVRFTGPRADWTLRLLHSGSDALEIEPWINGLRHDPLAVDESGALTLSVAGSLLELDPATRSWRAGITLVRKGDATPVFTALGAQRALPSMAGAPLLHPGVAVTPFDPVGRRVLGEGWDWPGPDGAVMSAPKARLRLSCMGHGAEVLRLEITPAPLMISGLGGVPLAVSPDGQGVQVTLPADQIQPSGLVDLTVTADPNEPHPRLSGLRLGAGLPTLSAVDLLAWAEEPENWQTDDIGLWLVKEASNLRLDVPPGATALEVAVMTLPGTGQSLRVSAAGTEAETKGEGPEALRIALPAGGDIRLHVETSQLVDLAEAGLQDARDGQLGGALLGVAFLSSMDGTR